MKHILAEAHWWFLDRLDFKGAHLIVEVTEGIVASTPQDVSIDDAGTIKSARPIEVTDRSRRIRIEFSNVLMNYIVIAFPIFNLNKSFMKIQLIFSVLAYITGLHIERTLND